ncbi:tetratricopeptide repeat protein, partial [Rubrivirga sp.]|uniref:tetratricopeptide repeat protein n=1 Tax=Rubrivirga sp. TaxID=1885344 RepID=UPI003C714C2A
MCRVIVLEVDRFRVESAHGSGGADVRASRTARPGRSFLVHTPPTAPTLRYLAFVFVSTLVLMRVVQSARFHMVLAVVVASVVSGCRPGTALHSRFNNFRAYYNTYYNAERALEAGEERLEQSSVTIDRTRLVSVFPATSGSNQGESFQEAIDKSADLLRERPDSKWADDALLVIGKAYFYQRNLAGAEQKFKETIAAAELAEERRLGDEAVFWLGRTYAAMNRFDEGIATLEGGIERDGVDRRWAGRMQIALGELYARARRWEEAADALRAGA